ncbi:hypothetical protein BBJ29_006959 [Phytophthora kernoviae]|uniref:C2H2-type domain-containing protein n=1 Tax=Phytophthora kernoviae TaxID=325452 RepID=A0A3F2RG15_9STRA|nr:hypothetical protein BBJ29_006959 [Phytophthora kernoviae]RLN55999.1 hypothetical protein BBP00_00008216 [Phytophthora kernoviae]
MNNNVLAITTATTRDSDSVSSVGSFLSLKRQRLNEEGASAAKEAKVKDSSSDPSIAEENTGENTHKNATIAAPTSSGYPSMALSLQKDPSWMLGDDSFGSLAAASRLESSAADEGSTTDNEGQSAAVAAAVTLSATAEGSGGNTKYMDPSTGEYMYPEDVKPMTFYDKQRLVQKITLLPSQYLRGLMDVISKYQPDTVRQIDDDGYAFDLGQMNENTVWAISDYVKDSMIELDGYIKSIASANADVSLEEQRQSTTTVLTSSNTSSNATDSSTAHQLSNDLALNSSKMSAITSNENQNKFLEQVEMYSKPKVTKSRVKPSKKHECPTCSKQFRGRSELQNHIRTHTGEKPLKCSYAGCTKRYAHSSNLRAHERTHAGVKPYACHYDGCGKSFAHSVSLKEHIWMHAGFQPYVCPYENCSKKFTQVSNFARHKKTHEKEERTSENEHSVESDN